MFTFDLQPLLATRFEVSEGVYDVYDVSGNIRITTRAHDNPKCVIWEHKGITYMSMQGFKHFKPMSFMCICSMHDYIDSVSQMSALHVEVEDDSMRFAWFIDDSLFVWLEGDRIP